VCVCVCVCVCECVCIVCIYIYYVGLRGGRAHARALPGGRLMGNGRAR
jgi:hypothetical protein